MSVIVKTNGPSYRHRRVTKHIAINLFSTRHHFGLRTGFSFILLAETLQTKKIPPVDILAFVQYFSSSTHRPRSLFARSNVCIHVRMFLVLLYVYECLCVNGFASAVCFHNSITSIINMLNILFT